MHALIVLLSLAYLSSHASAACYDLSGGTHGITFLPCNPSAKASACCAANKDGGDVCLDGGLCLAASGPWAGFIYGNGCTDPTGNDDACPHICPECT